MTRGHLRVRGSTEGPKATSVSSHEDWSINTASCLRSPLRVDGGLMLGVGIDWAEEFHLVAFGWPGDGVLGRAPRG